MSIEFVGGAGRSTTGAGRSAVWVRITGLVSGESGPVCAAVSYIGNGAIHHLPLKPNDTLVVNGSDDSLLAGSTNPTVLRAFAEKGVTVLSYDTLHSKVIVTPDRAVVGSANASARSVGTLDESVIITDDADAVRAAREYITNLTKNATQVDHDWLLKAEGLFRAGRNQRRSEGASEGQRQGASPDTGLDETSRLWLGRVVEEASDAQVETADGRPFIGVTDEDPTEIGDLVIVLEDLSGTKNVGKIQEVIDFDGADDGRVAVFAPDPWRPDKRRFPDSKAMESLLNDADDNWKLVEGREAIESLIPVKE